MLIASSKIWNCIMIQPLMLLLVKIMPEFFLFKFIKHQNYEQGRNHCCTS